MGDNNSRPGKTVGVVIYTSAEDVDLSCLQEILFGLEEEQIPFSVNENVCQTDDIVSTAYQAAKGSVFGVGICCLHDAVVVHQRNLAMKNPLFFMKNKQCVGEKARWLGINTARLIKKRPFGNL